MEIKTYPNKYPGTCIDCGKKAPVGRGVTFKLNGKWLVRCGDCDPNVAKAKAEKAAAVKAKLEAEEAARQQAEAQRQALIEKLGIDLTCGKTVVYRQEAYSDYHEVEYEYTGDGTDEEFRALLSAAPEASYGRLRWSNGASVKFVDRQRKVVLVSESVGICD